MFSNYFYINRSVSELSGLVSGKTILEVFSQEKNKLYVRLSSKDGREPHLVISIDQNQPYIIFNKSHRKARKNIVNFFEDFLPSKILKIETAVIDRIIKITLEESSLYFFIRGPRTNVVLIKDDGNISSFKKKYTADLETIKEEFEALNYSDKPIVPDFSEVENFTFNQIKKEYNFLPKEIINEAKVRWKEADSKNEILSEIISEIYSEKIRVSIIRDGKIAFQPESFYLSEESIEEKLFEDYSDAVQYLIAKQYSLRKKLKLQKEIRTFLETRLNKVSHKLNNLKNRIETGSREEKYKEFGGLLLANRNSLFKGMEEVELPDFSSGEKIKIKLDEKLSPQENIDNYFEKSRAERINYKTSFELYENSKKEYEFFKESLNKFETANSIKDLEELHKELGLNKTKFKMNSDSNFNYRRFLIEDKYHLFVGKDGKSNDYLSIKFSKQNDYWFHARGLPGSHVLLRTDNPKEGVPKNILESAASVAAFYSKAKTAKLAPVAYTFAKYVSKKKGMEPGQVNVMREKVLMVKPEIPDNCKFADS